MITPAKFWEKHPALFYGLCPLLGTLFALLSPWALLFMIPLLTKKRVGLATLLFLLPIVYLYHFYTFPSSESVVSGNFHIHSVRESRGFTRGWNYRGILKTDKGRLYCTIYSKKHYPADCAYKLTGLAYTQGGFFYSFRPFSWKPIEKSFSLAEVRFHAKKWVQSYIQRHIKQKRAAYFLTGMVTGALEDPVMLQEFGNLGLSHIMAISGFHFALLTLAFHLLLRLFLPQKVEALLLMCLLTLYLLFIGDSPSIQRAWSVAMIFLLGQLLERQPSPLNSLGAAIFLALLINPLSATTLSFQLSFLATAGILLLYAPLNRLLQIWIPSLSLREVIEYPLWRQHTYFFASLTREALALTTAVHLALLPLLLNTFHTFSFNSLIYNLFFPFCSSIALFLFLIGVATGGFIHPLTGWYCERLLSLTESPPLIFKTLYVDNVSLLASGVYIIILLILIIVYNYYYDRANWKEATEEKQGIF